MYIILHVRNVTKKQTNKNSKKSLYYMYMYAHVYDSTCNVTYIHVPGTCTMSQYLYKPCLLSMRCYIHVHVQMYTPRHTRVHVHVIGHPVYNYRSTCTDVCTCTCIFFMGMSTVATYTMIRYLAIIVMFQSGVLAWFPGFTYHE